MKYIAEEGARAIFNKADFQRVLAIKSSTFDRSPAGITIRSRINGIRVKMEFFSFFFFFKFFGMHRIGQTFRCSFIAFVFRTPA